MENGTPICSITGRTSYYGIHNTTLYIDESILGVSIFIAWGDEADMGISYDIFN